MDVLEEAGRAALAAAVGAWERNIVDPLRRVGDDESRAFIDAIARTPAGTNSGGARYRRNGDREWCGDFAAYCWGAAGLALELREIYFASTFRLDCYGRYAEAFKGISKREPGVRARWPKPEPVDERRLYMQLDAKTTVAEIFHAFRPRAGDILIVGVDPALHRGREQDRPPAFGTHVTIVESFDANRRIFNTIEGNATGLLPDGRVVQGVVRQQRALGSRGDIMHARRLIRPSIHDLATLALERGEDTDH